MSSWRSFFFLFIWQCFAAFYSSLADNKSNKCSNSYVYNKSICRQGEHTPNTANVSFFVLSLVVFGYVRKYVILLPSNPIIEVVYWNDFFLRSFPHSTFILKHVSTHFNCRLAWNHSITFWINFMNVCDERRNQKNSHRKFISTSDTDGALHKANENSVFFSAVCCSLFVM